MAKLVIQGTDIFYPLTDQPIIIGRSSQCEVTIHDERASRRHCKIAKGKEGYYLEDMGSYNGTYVNGEKVHRRVLEPEDQVRIGKTVFIFKLEEARGEDLPILLIQRKSRILYSVLLTPGSFSLGRGEQNDICIEGRQISSAHAVIFWKDRKWWIQDLHSKNGTYLNNKKIVLAPLNIGDVIRIGEIQGAVKPPGFKPEVSSRRFYYLVAGTLAGLLLLFFLVTEVRKWQSRFSFSPAANNLIGDFSFEYGSNWQLIGGVQISQNAAKSGRSSLTFSPLPEEIKEACYQESIRVAYGSAYRLSVWTKCKNLAGIAGVKIVWLDEGENALGESCSPLVAGNSDGWEKTEFVAYPPPYAGKFRIFCFALGKAEYLYMDDIALVAEKDVGEGFPSIRHEDLKVVLEPSGVGKIYYDTHLIVETGRFYEGRTGLIALGNTSKTEDKLLWKGEIYSLEGFEVAYKGEISFATFEAGIRIAMNLTPTGKSRGVSYVFTLPPTYLAEEVRVGDGFSGSYLSATPSEATVNYVVWENFSRPVGIFFSEPIPCRLIPEKGGFHIQPGGDIHSFQLVICQDLDARERRMQQLEKEATEYEGQKRPGLAIQCYQKVVADFAYHPEAPKIREKIQRLQLGFCEDIEALYQMRSRAPLYQNVEVYARLLQEYNMLHQKWEGIEEAERLTEDFEEVFREEKAMRMEESEEISQELLARAQDLTREYPALAWMFYREILETYPETNAATQAMERSREIEREMPEIFGEGQ